MAQTGETKFVVTAGVPSIEETGEVKFQVTAGIPSAWTAAAPPIGAIMNQFQGANIGADLFNGTLL